MTEPPINRNPLDLDPEFRKRLALTLGQLALKGIYFKFHEGFRTVARQQWLYAQGRTRPGNKVTNKDGVDENPADGINDLSNHQGDGTPGSGKAADCYLLVNGKVVLDAPASIWKRYAEVAEQNGLTAGYRWTKPHDPPHIELRKLKETIA